MAKVYVVTDEYYDYEETSSKIVGIFDSQESAEAGKAAYIQKFLDMLSKRNIICGRCQCSKEYHKGGQFPALAKKNEEWKKVLKEYRKAGRLCNDGVFHTPKPVTELNERQSIEINEYEMGVIADT